MNEVELILLLMAVVAVVGVVSERSRLPMPVLLVVAGTGVALVPGLPQPKLDPDSIFLLFVPPILYRAAIHTSLHDVRRYAGGIAFLSFTMVMGTMCAVAATAHYVGGLAWGTSFVLGAIVAPPDSVASIALTRRVRLPRGIVVLLRGEGLINDASAFVSYRMAAAALVAGSFSPSEAIAGFVTASVVGVSVGVALGFLLTNVRRWLRDIAPVEITISLLTPFVAFMVAERSGGSGILAVVAVGLYLGHWSPQAISPTTRLQAMGTWSSLLFQFEGMIFMLVGFELPAAISILRGRDAVPVLMLGAAIVVVIILVRILLTLPRVYVAYYVRRALRLPAKLPVLAQAFFVSWSGVRGGESLVVALSLPLLAADGSTLRDRDLIIFLTVVVIVGTLVLQGMSFERLARVLKLDDAGAEEGEEYKARQRMRDVALACIADREERGDASAEIARHARLGLDRLTTEGSQLQGAIVLAQRHALLSLYDDGHIGQDVMQRLQNELDFASMLIRRWTSS